MSNITPNGVLLAGGERLNYALSTDPTTALSFFYTSGANANFVIVPFPNLLSEGGADAPLSPFPDNHILTTLTDTCEFNDIYKIFTTGLITGEGVVNSQSGLKYPGMGYIGAGWGTDAAGMPLQPLIVHIAELMDAGLNANVDAIKHAGRITFDAGSIHAGLNIWPATLTGSTGNVNAPPYGARLRLKASYTWPGFDGLCPTTFCHNVVNAVIQWLKNYGFFVSDIGSNWNLDYDGGSATNFDIFQAFREVNTNLTGNSTNFEVVNEAPFNTNATDSGTDPNNWRVKLGNGIVTPDNAMTIVATDSLSQTGQASIALQGVAVGVENPTELMMAGCGTVQFNAWATGATNRNVTYALSPSGGANGTITSGGLYTCPSTGAVSSRTNTTVTVTSVADNTVSATFLITVIPVDANGALDVSLGKAQSSDYPDTASIVWYSDLLTGIPDTPTLFPPFQNSLSNGLTSPTGANSAVAPGIYTQGTLGAENDFHFKVHVANGTHTLTAYIGNLADTAINQAAFSFDCNGTRTLGITDVFTQTGALNAASALTCTVNATTGLIHAAVRYQGVNLGTQGGQCTIPCYATGGALFMNAIKVSAAAALGPTSVLSTSVVVKTTTVVH